MNTNFPKNSQETIAYFDVDNTLLRGSSLYYFGLQAFKLKLIGTRDLLMFAWHQARFVAVGENKRHLSQVKERALELLSGHKVGRLEEIAQTVLEKNIKPRLWPETVRLLKEHLAQGHEVWLITASPKIIADVIADYLGATGALGTELESVNGVYTGNLEHGPMHAERKATTIEKITSDRGIDLSDCWAYSDSRNDIPMLNLVGNPVAVNPDKALNRYAKARNWKIVRMTKKSLNKN